MSTTIYYFSGTGNSLVVARDIAARTEGVLRSIPILMQKERIRPAAGAIGLVYPVYNKGIPLILKRFVEKLEGLEDRYLFGVCTCGDTTGFAIRDLRKLIERSGGELAAGFTVRMPYNYLTPTLTLRDFYGSFTLREIPLEKQRDLFAAEKERVANIAAYVNARESGTFETNIDILNRIADHFDLEATLGRMTWQKPSPKASSTAICPQGTRSKGPSTWASCRWSLSRWEERVIPSIAAAR